MIILIKPLHHRDLNCYGLFFKKDPDLIRVVKTIPGIRFSATHACWYVPVDDIGLDEIIEKLKDQEVDATAFRPAPVEVIEVGETTVDRLPTDGPILDRAQEQALRMLEQKLSLKGYSVNTRKSYRQQFKQFLEFYSQYHPLDINEADIRNYLLYLAEKRKLSKSMQNMAINAIKFFYEKVAMQERRVYHLDRPARDKILPEILSEGEVMRIFEAAGNLKHRCMLMLTYSAGLRRSEVLNLRVGDVQLERNVVFIKGGKGKKDRQSILAQSLVPLLESYLREYDPGFYFFEGRGGQRYSETTLRVVLKEACEKAGIKRRVNLHMLRHSFATHLLEAGTPTRYIQELLGHESPKTTEIYAQVTKFGMQQVRSPLDHIAAKKTLREADE